VTDFDQQFYVCGPPKFNEAVNAAPKDLGADPELLVFEQWSTILQREGTTDA
jgi:ferredoxin-NADP reductase